MVRFKLGKLWVVSVLVVSCIVTFGSSAQAQSRNSGGRFPSRDSRAGAATRSELSECIAFPADADAVALITEDYQWNLVALLPDLEQTQVVLTTQTYPTLFWYKPSTIASYARLSILRADAEQSLIYASTFRIEPEAGIVSTQIPSSAGLPSLEPGESYTWSIELLCGTDNRTADPIFLDLELDAPPPLFAPASPGGVRVQYIAPIAAFQSQLAAAGSAAAQVPIYVQSGYWLEALTMSMQAYCDRQAGKISSAEFQQVWQDLLTAIDLPQLATAPIAQHCPIAN
ncbi:MAG: DUF928 domain-containing protein [Cyanobacteria bacterium P01_H01_bin.121]